MARLHFDKTNKKDTVADAYLMDNYLSLRAKGMLSFLYMMSTDLTFKFRDLMQITTDGVGAIRGAFRELEHLGYISKKMLRDEHGKFVTIQYTVHKVPRTRTVGGDHYC